MDSSVAGILGAVTISRVLIAILIVSGLWLGVGYFFANSKYDKGYLQGQLDYQKGIIKIKIDTTTTFHLK